MAKNQSPPPLVTSVSTKLKRTISTSNTQVVSPEEVKEKKKDLLGIITQSVELFKKNLSEGKVEMNTSLDLERLVRLTLLLSGEADSVSGKPYGEQEQETTISGLSPAEVSMSKIEEILDLSDPDVLAMYEKIYTGYNNKNDTDS